MKEQLTLIKAGGKVLDSDEELNKLLKLVTTIPGKRILVHGGGIFIDQLCERLNIPTQMVNGRRITSPENMDVVLMACGGKLNKQLVAGLNKLGQNALGLTGGDLNLIQSHKREPEPIDFGMVGDIDSVNSHWLELLVNNGVIPVVASITQSNDFELLNTNADTIAAHLSVALASTYNVQLFFYFDKPGVLSDSQNDQSVIPQLSRLDFETMKEEKTIHTGMLPKLHNGFFALEKGVAQVSLGNQMERATNLVID